MGFLRKLLWPLGVVYGAITGVRNMLYDRGILKSEQFDIPIIAVGNLSVGGTGKSPMIEYLIRLLSEKYKIATLSRGYKRKSEGFVLADKSSDAETLGDEPYQFHRKFPNVSVAVDANRRRGIKKLVELVKPDVILLDDAYQHRKVRAGFYILLTSYDSLYVDDLILPAGNLREGRAGSVRADIIVVTKCPQLTDAEQVEIRKKLKSRNDQPVYFSKICYGDEVIGDQRSYSVLDIRKESKLLIAGIAKPQPFIDHLRSADDDILIFPDHHSFSNEDVAKFISKAAGRKIVTTEKDYVRIKRKLPDLFYLEINSEFLAFQSEFDDRVRDYVSRHG